MTRSELVQIVAARNPHLYHRDVERIVDIILEGITEALEKGNRVELRGFGSFSVRHRPPRSGHNPRNGETVFVDDKWVPFFKAGKEIQEHLNSGNS
ncbi:integration host factor subunit beta [Rhizobium sp. B230/85]|uniref:integration host factor subunit beta n=1 Tax=Rhizobium sp. B230/85 TaxID=2819994 RepID=UPI001C5BEC5C|nr:integration host factor subunit beta [Rhizobium sp. B230/85]QXZ98801.1 integration host factor subunit beta [Rhizobium sp. B230/85]